MNYPVATHSSSPPFPPVLFVTGLCGRLGRAVACEADAQGWLVRGLDIAPWPDDMEKPPSVELHIGSLDDYDLLDRLLEGSTHFIHTAGLHGGNLADHTLSDFLDSNVTQVGRLLERCVKKGVRRVGLSSTMEVLIGRTYDTSGAVVLDESFPLRTDSAYSISRALMERLAAEIAPRLGLSISVLRYMAFGYKRDASLAGNLLARHLTPADAARAALKAVSIEGWKGEIFHIGPKTPFTNSDIIQALDDPAAVVDKYFPGGSAVLEHSGYRLTSDMFWPITSIEKARRLLGWEPSYTFASWLEAHGWENPVSGCE